MSAPAKLSPCQPAPGPKPPPIRPWVAPSNQAPRLFAGKEQEKDAQEGSLAWLWTLISLAVLSSVVIALEIAWFERASAQQSSERTVSDPLPSPPAAVPVVDEETLPPLKSKRASGDLLSDLSEALEQGSASALADFRTTSEWELFDRLRPSDAADPLDGVMLVRLGKQEEDRRLLHASRESRAGAVLRLERIEERWHIVEVLPPSR